MRKQAWLTELIHRQKKFPALMVWLQGSEATKNVARSARADYEDFQRRARGTSE